MARTAIWKTITATLTHDIATGKYAPGDRLQLPPEVVPARREDEARAAGDIPVKAARIEIFG